ncbi:MAG: PQQ-binding-like beta-propeller repeat protein [bacterium]
MNRLSVLIVLGIIAACFMPLFAASEDDYPMYRANGNRSGNTSILTNTGDTKLTWYFPMFKEVGTTIQLDNDDPDPLAVVPLPTNYILIDGSTYDVTTHLLDPIAGWTRVVDPDASTARIGASYFATEVVVITPQGETEEDAVFQARVQAAVTKQITWTIHPDKPRRYSIEFFIPSFGTILDGTERSQPDSVWYKIEYGNNQVKWVPVDQRVGNQWLSVGEGSSFLPLPDNTIKVTLTNVTSAENADVNPKKIVLADAIRAVPLRATAYSSPAVANVDTDPAAAATIFCTRNEMTTDSVDTSGATAAPGGVVYALNNTGGVRWRYPLVVVRNFTNNIDNFDSATDDRFTRTPTVNWVVPDPADLAGTNPYGVDFLWAPTAAVGDSFAHWRIQGANSSPTSIGRYNVFVWIPKDENNKFVTAAKYIIHYAGEDGAALTQTVTINQNRPVLTDAAGSGGQWVALGTGTYLHDPDAGGLDIELSNESAENGKFVVADAVAFVSRYNSPIYSSPTVEEIDGKWVVLVSSDDGHVYCLDAAGDGNGNTWAYWVYPSIGTAADDPNRGDGSHYYNGAGGTNYRDRDAPPVSKFGYSSPVVKDNKVYIANSNGRFYCINAIGRKDYDSINRKPGTTWREWAYPDVMLQTSTGTVVEGASPLGYAFVASPSVDANSIYITSPIGRCFSLVPDGDGIGRSKLNWVYPSLPSTGSPGSGLGGIFCTPAVDDNSVYFSSSTSNLDGTVYALDKTTGAPRWSWSGAGIAANVPLARMRYSSPLLMTLYQDEAFTQEVPALIIGNNNGRMYALATSNAGGFQPGAFLYESDTLFGGIDASPTAVIMNTADKTLRPNQRSIVVGTRGGQIAAIYADLYPSAKNDVGTRMMWGQSLGQQNVGIFASCATSRGYFYTASEDGFIYAFSTNDLLSQFGGDYPADEGPPVQEQKPPDQQAVSAEFNKAKVATIDYDSYRKLLQKTIRPGEETQDNRTAFEWGDRVYLLIKDFKYLPHGATAPKADASEPNVKGLLPEINVQLSNSSSNISYKVSQIFNVVLTGDPKSNGGDVELGDPVYSNAVPYRDPTTGKVNPDAGQVEGYALLQIDLNYPYGSNKDWLTPGEKFTIGIQTKAKTLGTVVTIVNVSIPMPGTFMLANPLAIAQGQSGSLISIGNNTSPSGPGSAVNGNGLNVNLPLFIPETQHGSAGSSLFSVSDRSVLSLNINSGKTGLTNVRVAQTDLAFLGGANSVYKLLPFDDPPGLNDGVNISGNNSLDYPDINLRQETILHVPTNIDMSVVPSTGRSTTGITLTAPTPIGTIDRNNPAQWANRTLAWDSVLMTVNVPRYQPPCLYQDANHKGYGGNLYVYVDLDGNKDFTGGPVSFLSTPPPKNEEPYRQIDPTLSVAVDEKLAIQEDVVDLGSLPQGALLEGGLPFSATNIAWPPSYINGAATNPKYASFFKPFTVRNLGNVNLLNVRLLKQDGGNRIPLFSDTVSGTDWIPADLCLISSLDKKFDPFSWVFGAQTIPVRTSGIGTPTLHKARPGDRTATVMTIPDRPYNTQPYPDSKPRVAIGIPLGQPSGTYSQIIGVVEQTNAAGVPNTNDDGVLHYVNGVPGESYSNPSMKISVRVREARLTNGFTTGNLIQVDPPQVNTTDPTKPPLSMATNVMPIGYRTSTGDLGLITVSNRVSAGNGQYQPGDNWWLYSATLSGGTTSPSAAGVPLANLYAFQPSTPTQWWNYNSTGFPTAQSMTTLMTGTAATPVSLPGNLQANTAMVGSPSLPLPSGVELPTIFDQPYVYFVGQVYRQDASGQNRPQNLLMYTRMTGNAPTETKAVTIVKGSGSSLPDPWMAKYRPIPVYLNPGQGSDQTALFWSGATTGNYKLFYIVGNPGTNSWGDMQRVTTPSGFTSVMNPFPVLRMRTTNTKYIDLYYEGIARGQQTSEIFMSRYPINNGRLGNPMAFARVIAEKMKREGNQPVWRTQHLSWLVSGGAVNPSISVKSTNGTPQVIVKPEDWTYDSSSLLLSAPCALGGTAVADASAGTVRFSTAAPLNNEAVLIDYTPQTKRITEPNLGGGSKPIVLLDKRISTDQSMIVGQPAGGFRSDRMWAFYSRTGVTRGQSTTFYYKTMRFGVKLKHPVRVSINPDGTPNLGNMPAVGAIYQVDPGVSGSQPVPGRIFFNEEFEDVNNPNASLSISYLAGDIGQMVTEIFDGQPGNGAKPDWIDEQSEQAVPIEQIVNEANLWVYPDITAQGNLQSDQVWLFWNSSRAGSDDLYYMTIAPRFSVFNKTQ